jgi:hypothetical protein
MCKFLALKIVTELQLYHVHQIYQHNTSEE